MCVLQCVLQYVLMCVLMYVLQLTTGSNPVHCYCRGPVLQLHLHPSLASRLPPPHPLAGLYGQVLVLLLPLHLHPSPTHHLAAPPPPSQGCMAWSCCLRGTRCCPG